MGIVLFIRSQWGQDIIVAKVVKYLSGKTGTKVEIDRLYVTFMGNVYVEGLYLADKKGDTLLYSKSLEANLPLRPLIFGTELNIRAADWQGLIANVSRSTDSKKFNFDFLVEAFTAQDTTMPKQEASSFQVKIGSLNFEDFKIRYDDAYLGFESSINLGKLELDARKTDLKSLHFEVTDFALSNTQILYKQYRPFPVVEDTSQVPLPYLAFDNFALDNVKANYTSLPAGITADFNIQKCHLQLPHADLGKNEYEIDSFTLSDSDIRLQLVSDNSEEVATKVDTVKSTRFEWPDYIIHAKRISFQDNLFQLSRSNKNSKAEDTSDLSFSKIRLKADQLSYGNKTANLQVSGLSFLEGSGFQLQDLSFDAQVQNTRASISKLNINSGNSSLNGDLELQYPSVDQFIKVPEKTRVELNLPRFKISLRDVLDIYPELKNNAYVIKASENDFTGSVAAKGTLQKIQIQKMEIDWGDHTSLVANGLLENITEGKAFLFDAKDLKVVTVREDLQRFASETNLGISIPETLLIQASGSGNMKNLKADAFIKIPEGSAKITAQYADQGIPSIEGKLQVDSLQLGALLNNPNLGNVAFTMDAAASGNSMNSLNAKLNTSFTKLQYKKYDFSKLKLTADVTQGQGVIDMTFKDPNLDMLATAQMVLDSINTNIKFDLDIKGADLYGLGVTNNPIKTAVQFTADFKGNLQDFSLTGLVSNGIAVSDKEQYRMGNVQLSAAVGKKMTDIKISSNFLNASLLSNSSPKRISEALVQHFKNYFIDTTAIKPPVDPVTLEMDLTLSATPIVTEVFFNGVEQLDTISASANFDEAARKLYGRIDLPRMTYKGIKMDSLQGVIKGAGTSMAFDLGVAGITSGRLHVQNTKIHGDLNDHLLALDFLAFDKTEKLMHIASNVTIAKDTITVRIVPQELILNKESWSIPENNDLMIANEYLGFKNFKLVRNSQELLISSTLPNVNKEHIGVTFKDFRLQTFLSLLNSDEELVTGYINGQIVMEDPFEASGLVADFRIDKLNVFQNPLGNLSLKASSKESKNYDFNLAIKDGGLDLDLKGDYVADMSGALLNLDLDLNRLKLEFIQGITKDVITDSQGYLSGKFKITGTTNSPKYEGNLNFNGADFKVVSLNTDFKISEEAIKVNSSGVYFDKFIISDANNETFTIDGSILTVQLTNPTFDLRLVADKFQVLNSKKGDNQLFYGEGRLDADIGITGNLDHPKIKGKLNVGEGTNFTYVVPESQLDIQERDGVVIFVNREEPDNILTRNDQEDTPSIFKGFDVNAVLDVTDGAIFNIVIDERTGDNLQVSGNGQLNLNISPNGSVNLSGRYELTSGHYETNLYNLVKRKFEIQKGSTITWGGDPTNAILEVRAVYAIETSAAPLMTSVSLGGDASLSGKYRQSLPFLVYLNVDGRLLSPKLSFGLDMPENQQGSFGGAVYDRVQQLNGQETELNKQVFSLLALNRFLPDSGSDGSSGGATAIARNNVNKLLSQELNQFSGKVFGKTGLEVDFGLDSFTDYQGSSPTDRTQLNINARKKLFDNRLIVTAGSSVPIKGSPNAGEGSTPIIGNLSLEYLLTEDGRYRLSGFQKNEYENAIDGQLTITGIALILNWEFNRLSEIFSPFKESTEPKEVKK
ncbi:MAG: translocation/assembly module TamB [Maribacter sp.]|nr:translocation/assembly module TamB [Maribacter sp.]